MLREDLRELFCVCILQITLRILEFTCKLASVTPENIRDVIEGTEEGRKTTAGGLGAA